MGTQRTGRDPDASGGASIALPVPIRGEQLFKHSAGPRILDFLAESPSVDVTVRMLTDVTGMSERATRDAVDALEANDLVETYREGTERRVHINRERLERPDDPVLSVPQTLYQVPVRVARQYILDELEDVEGIVLFGSVARAEADRQSDIDLWVLVGGDHMEQRHAANKLERKLDGLQIPASVTLHEVMGRDWGSNWSEIREQLESDEADLASAERYSFDITVETPASAINKADQIDAVEIFGRGITLDSTEAFEEVRRELLGHD